MVCTSAVSHPGVRPRNKDLVSATRPVSVVADGIIRQKSGSVPLNATTQVVLCEGQL